MRSIVCAFTILTALSLPGGTVRADPMVGSPEDGLAYAREVCSTCHIVEPSQRRVMLIESLSFAQIAADAGTTEMGLRAFFITPHVVMPDFIFTPKQKDDLIAYILSLKDTQDVDRP